MKIKFYHCTSRENLEKILKYNKIFSEKKARRLGLIKESSTGEIDRRYRRDNFVFLSHQPQNYGEIIFIFSPEILNLPSCYVATAGDFLHFCDTPKNIKYFKNSIISGKDFPNYIENFLKELPNPDWFFGKKRGLKKFLSEAIIENINGNSEKLKLYWRLFPEIMVKNELPLKYLIKIKEKNNERRNYSL